MVVTICDNKKKSRDFGDEHLKDRVKITRNFQTRYSSTHVILDIWGLQLWIFLFSSTT